MRKRRRRPGNHPRATDVRVAVIPAAGLGSRFLPETKFVPKELLPLFDRPMLIWTLSEARAAGIREFIIVTSREKLPIFKRALALDRSLIRRLRNAGKERELAVLEEVSFRTIRFVLQEEQRGLGDAVLTAREAVGNRPFAVLLPDNLFLTARPALAACLDQFRGCTAVLGLTEVSREEVSSYGMISPKMSGGEIEVQGVVQKPAPADAPSLLADAGRYVFGPAIFDYLAKTAPGVGGEIQLTDAIDVLAKETKVSGVILSGWFDVGTPRGWLAANIAWAKREGGWSGEN